MLCHCVTPATARTRVFDLSGGRAIYEVRLVFCVYVEALFERGRGQNWNLEVVGQGQQILVAGNQCVSFGGDCQSKKGLVEWIAAVGNVDFARHVDGFTPRQIVAEQVFPVCIGQLELRIRENPNQFLGRISAHQGANNVRLLGMA